MNALRGFSKLASVLVASLLLLLIADPSEVEAVRRTTGKVEGYLLLVAERHDEGGGFERVYEFLETGKPAMGNLMAAGSQWSSLIKSSVEIKQHLISKDPRYLQLPPGTIVPEWIWQQWDREGYTPVHEFEIIGKNKGTIWNPVPVSQWHSSYDVAEIFGTNQPPQGGDDGGQAASFRDVIGHWAQADIERMVAAGVIKGYPDGTFKPDNTVTRAEFIALVRRIKAASGAGNSTSFNDIAQHWARDDIQALEAQGWLVAEEHDRELAPDKPMPRQEMARLVARAMDLDPVPGNTQFNDDHKIPATFRPFINAAVGKGLISGYPNGNFEPQGALTRAEAATMLVRIMDMPAD